MSKHFAKAIDVTLAISALLVAVGVWLNYSEERRLRESLASPTVPFEAGTKLPALPGVSFADSKQTVVLMLRSTCPYCTESVDFYKQLLARRQDAKNLRVVALSAEPVETLDAYLESHKLSFDKAVSVPSGSFPTLPTPTLILVDATGTAERVWVGRLQPDREQEVFAALSVSLSAHNEYSP
jgi:peroxiredoxin